MSRPATLNQRAKLPAATFALLNHYTYLCAIPARVRIGTAQIVADIADVAAITLPTDTAEAFAAYLRKTQNYDPPVIVTIHPAGTTTATLLTTPIPTHLHNDHATATILRKCQASMSEPEGKVLLPAPSDPARRWLRNAPTSRLRPTPESVVDYLRQF
ncbi:hypothetical protein ACIGO9_30420 [Nocardia asteroides]|uniref:hypothetical protein n=1 Tax=Nocardia asteroides TaxID=1824 RepID=UPI0037C9C9B2